MPKTAAAQEAPAPQAVGYAREPLRQPEAAAQVSVAEAAEIKERKRLIDAASVAASDAQKVLQLLRNENLQFLQSLVKAKSLAPEDEYNVDSDAGIIWRTARLVVPTVIEQVQGEPVEG